MSQADLATQAGDAANCLIGVVYVPLLMITHGIGFYRLLRPQPQTKPLAVAR